MAALAALGPAAMCAAYTDTEEFLSDLDKPGKPFLYLNRLVH